MARYQKLVGKHVLIIGGTSGIGYGVAEACIESGARVTVASSSPARVEAAVKSLAAIKSPLLLANPQPPPPRGFVCDLGSAATIQANVAALFDAAGPDINHVVYAAGDSLPLLPLAEITPQFVLAATQLRMVAPLMVAREAAARLARSPDSSLTLTSGSVANKPTSAGWTTTAYMGGGLEASVRSLAVEMAPVRVNCVEPGVVIDTPLWEPLGEQGRREMEAKESDKCCVGRAGRVVDVVEAYMWLLKDGNASATVAGTNGGMFVM